MRHRLTEWSGKPPIHRRCSSSSADPDRPCRVEAIERRAASSRLRPSLCRRSSPAAPHDDSVESRPPAIASEPLARCTEVATELRQCQMTVVLMAEGLSGGHAFAALGCEWMAAALGVVAALLRRRLRATPGTVLWVAMLPMQLQAAFLRAFLAAAWAGVCSLLPPWAQKLISMLRPGGIGPSPVEEALRLELSRKTAQLAQKEAVIESSSREARLLLQKRDELSAREQEHQVYEAFLVEVIGCLEQRVETLEQQGRQHGLQPSQGPQPGRSIHLGVSAARPAAEAPAASRDHRSFATPRARCSSATSLIGCAP